MLSTKLPACDCVTLDRPDLYRSLDAAAREQGFGERLLGSHPHLISDRSILLGRRHAERMADIISAIETVVRDARYQASTLDQAAEPARLPSRAAGVLMGYDFHLAADGPKLIEVNTNAGGAAINALVGAAQRACCSAVSAMLAPIAPATNVFDDLHAMFVAEYARERPGRPLLTVAIVDEAPPEQFLYPEFVLFKALLERRGIRAVIAAPDELRREGGVLVAGDLAVDFVYNRLTDFMLQGAEVQALAGAYRAGEVVVSPNPRVHALYANKRNLVTWSDPEALGAFGLGASVIETLTSGVPRTRRVSDCDPDVLWRERRGLFFKPADGFGSRAVYRGDKITKRIWSQIVSSDYIAQDLVPPSTEVVRVDGQSVPLKVDLRAYTYDGQPLLFAARLYQGQVTNMRTPGGGFSPVHLACCGMAERRLTAWAA